MKLYKIDNCYSAQIEGAGLNFRYRYTCMGIAPPHWFWHRRVLDLPKWYRAIFPISLGINYHSGQCDQKYYFELQVGCLRVYWISQGERSKNDLRHYQAGLHVSWTWNTHKLIF